MKHSDLTEGNIWKHIYSIALPAVFGQIFNMLYNWVDAYWGGKLGTDALSAFGVTFPIFLFAIAVGQGIAFGGMVLISNALGEKNISVSKHYMKQTVLLSITVGVILCLITIIFSKSLIIFWGVQGRALELSVSYIQILAIGIPFLLVFFGINTSLISQGNTKFMRNILIMNFMVNLGLDPLLMYGFTLGNIIIIPSMGIQGIAMATVLVQMLGAILAWIKIQNMESTKWKKGDSNIPQISSGIQIIKYGLPTF